MPRDPDRRRQEAKEHIDALAGHVRGVLNGMIPEDAPVPGGVPANPNPNLPWWFGEACVHDPVAFGEMVNEKVDHTEKTRAFLEAQSHLPPCSSPE